VLASSCSDSTVTASVCILLVQLLLSLWSTITDWLTAHMSTLTSSSKQRSTQWINSTEYTKYCTTRMMIYHSPASDSSTLSNTQRPPDYTPSQHIMACEVTSKLHKQATHLQIETNSTYTTSWPQLIVVILTVSLYLSNLVAKALDLQLAGCKFDSRPRRCRVTTLGKLFTPTCLSRSQWFSDGMIDCGARGRGQLCLSRQPLHTLPAVPTFKYYY